VEDAEILSIETNVDSVEESTPGARLLPVPLEAVEEALRVRLAGETPGNDAATEIAQALDLTRLAPAEKSAILSTADDRFIATIRATVVLGLVAREATRLQGPLERLCAALEPCSTPEPPGAPRDRRLQRGRHQSDGRLRPSATHSRGGGARHHRIQR
jgi:hypothetical protein